jgi:hypothetical protein
MFPDLKKPTRPLHGGSPSRAGRKLFESLQDMVWMAARLMRKFQKRDQG